MKNQTQRYDVPVPLAKLLVEQDKFNGLLATRNSTIPVRKQRQRTHRALLELLSWLSEWKGTKFIQPKGDLVDKHE